MQLTDTIHILRPSLGSMVYILQVDDGVTVVDTGSEPENAHKIVAYITRKLLRPQEEVRHIVLTHWHGDHSGAAEELRRLTGGKIYCHPQDAVLLAGDGEVDVCLGKPMPRSNLKPFIQGVCAFGYMAMRANTHSLRTDAELQEGDAPFGSGWLVLHLPGHTPGSCGLWLESERILIAGDTVVTLGKQVKPPFQFLIEDLPALAASWRKIRELGKIEWLLPGHINPLRMKRGLELPRALERVD
jgi:glyoxylase-like metal-dependent hydrolase (beta-lactamase superfamily II)